MKPNYIIIPLVTFFVAAIGSWFTSGGMEWYETINLPTWTPPGSVIGVVWTTLFILAAISALIVWNKAQRNNRFWRIIVLFLANAGLNIFWSFLFFNQYLIGPAVWEAGLLGLSVIVLVILIWPISRWASALLVPYAIWVAFASFLTFTIWTLQLPEISTINSFEECVSAGYPVLESYPRQCKIPGGATFAEDIGNELEKTDLIKIYNPRPNQIIETPLFVKGEARGNWYFEADFPIKLFDDNGFLLGITPAQALGDWMTEDFVAFSAPLSFAAPSSLKGKLILEKDNPSGLPEYENELTVPVYFKEAQGISQELMTVKIFLNDSRFVGEPYFDCSRTIAVERQVPKTLAVAKAATEALLRGATQEEIYQGFVSNINSGVRIQKLTIEDGVAKADFDEQLEFQVGGSCRVAAIMAQITETLKQFPTVDSVIISINGRTEDILNP
ncbi:tryptophan-rich sensory protein [Patescibacteria group bacterium]|nr:tryptophan-rich sensory protein [Patescibacteria group bacterium]